MDVLLDILETVTYSVRCVESHSFSAGVSFIKELCNGSVPLAGGVALLIDAKEFLLISLEIWVLLHLLGYLRLNHSLISRCLVKLVVVKLRCIPIANFIKLSIVILELFLLATGNSIERHLRWIQSLLGCLLLNGLFEGIHSSFAELTAGFRLARHDVVGD